MGLFLVLIVLDEESEGLAILWSSSASFWASCRARLCTADDVFDRRPDKPRAALRSIERDLE